MESTAWPGTKAAHSVQNVVPRGSEHAKPVCFKRRRGRLHTQAQGHIAERSERGAGGRSDPSSYQQPPKIRIANLIAPFGRGEEFAREDRKTAVGSKRRENPFRTDFCDRIVCATRWGDHARLGKKRCLVILPDGSALVPPAKGAEINVTSPVLLLTILAAFVGLMRPGHRYGPIRPDRE